MPVPILVQGMVEPCMKYRMGLLEAATSKQTLDAWPEEQFHECAKTMVSYSTQVWF